ncbi:uncharacterized protein si:ch211-266o15.1 isoform X1 [Pygocentrus nattereri]|uniref:THAP-type domain-containing protein n=1 Tax=Pygocentrus nattereri TaxID=42514 RepID=A0A3B4CC97_PYGNA|nr:uncharacterized protein si:ch211-266o15.1 isoform X1 [Pygocentrus nattereri]
MPSFYRCGVAGCTNNSETDPGANFYRLPDGELRSSWTEFLVSRGGTASNRIRVCSSHFTKDQFHNFTQVKLGFGKKRKLVDGAVPSLPPVPPSAARRSQQNVISMAEECHREEEQSSGAEMERSGEGSLRSVADLPAESSSSSERPQRGAVEDELDGFPVFGADEEDWESSSSQRGRHSEEQDESESQSRKVSQQSGANADDSAQQSQMEEGTSQNETSTSSQEQGGSFREETLYSPLMKIKDEPIDEGYDKALIPPSDISRVKEELENGEHEIATPPDELRISSVFSVRGAGDPISGSVAASQPPAFSTMSQSTSAIKAPLMVLPAQPQPQLQAKPLAQIQLQLQPQLQLQTQPQPQLQLQPQPQLQLQPQLQPQPPPASIRICCSGCSKVLQKGQTAFQRKGSNQLFCSTVCLTGFTLPPTISIAPKKTCHLCLKVIGNPKDLITVPVDSSNTLKEFCSQACLTIYRSRVEGFSEDSIVRCTMCRNPSEIQHEVNHQGVLHRLCSDECFSRFRSSKRLSMSCCESCGNCTVTGNYHLVQIEDAVKKFCSPVCISTYKQKSGKRVHCPYCHEFKSVDQMLEGTNAQGVIEFFCSSRCVTNSQASRTLSGASFPCTNCQKLAIPQYHLAMPDGSIRNFCSYECACRFQEKLQRAPTQMNGGSAVAPNTILNMAPRGPQYVSSRPPAPLNTPNLSASYMTASSQNPPSFVPTSNQNPIPPYVPAPGLANPQDSQNQQPDAPASAQSTIRLTCKQCQKQFRSKPEVLQFKNHVGLFCSRLCCDAYKREKDVRAVCEYCKEEKVLKDITMYEHKPRAFCCEGCKLLFKHDLAKQHGSQCRVCAYCCNMTHSTIQNHFGGKLEEFCTEECMSLYTVLFYEMAKCYWCKTQGTLSESLKWDGTIKHFCNLRCVLQFCSKSVVPDQPNSNGITTSATAAQAPLSLSKDMPVIGGVVSLASALAGNTALTGALPTSNASSKIIGDASTQTDAAVNVSPHQRRMLKNKALMCKPIIEEQGVQCHLEPPKPLFDTVVDENGEKVKLVPVPVPIPMPVYIPVPMHLYTQFTPVPLGLPLPVPVPLVMPASPESTQHTVTKASVPSQSSVEDEEAEKSKDRPVSHGDQGSTYSGDLESEARSTPFSWADTEDSSQLHKPSVPSFQIERPANTPTASTSPSPLDLEKDFPVASNDCGSSKEQKSPKRRKRGKRAAVVEKLKEKTDIAPSCTRSFSDTDLGQSSMETCQTETLDANTLSNLECILIGDEQAEPQMSRKSGPQLRSSSRSRSSLRPDMKPYETVGSQKLRTKRQFCFYCKEPNAKMARHLECKHQTETDVAHALRFPKGSRRRHLLLERLCKKGNYLHNVEVLQSGNEEIAPKNQTKANNSMMEFSTCQYCLAFYRRRALLKHERSCKMKMNLRSCSNFLQQPDTKCSSQSGLESSIEPTSELTSQPLATLSPVRVPNQCSSPEPRQQPSLDSSSQPSISFCPESITLPNIEIFSMPSTQFTSEILKAPSLESCDRTSLGFDLVPSPQLGQPCAESFYPPSSDLGEPPSPESCHEPNLESSLETSPQTNEISNQVTDGFSLQKSTFASPESCHHTALRTTSDPIPQPDEPHLESPARSDPDFGAPLTPDSCLQLTFNSSPEPSPQSHFETCLQFMETCSSETDYPNSCQQTSLRISPEPSPQSNQTSFESCFPTSVKSSSELSPGPSSQPSLETDPSSAPEIGHKPNVELGSQLTFESHVKCSVKSSPQKLCLRPTLRRKYNRRTSLICSTYNLRSKSSVVPKVSPCIDKSGNNEQKLDADVSSASENDPIHEKQTNFTMDSGGKSDGMRQFDKCGEVCSTLNSSCCQKSFKSEMKSSTEIIISTESPSSPVSTQSFSIICSTSSSSVPSQQLTLNNKTLGGHKLLSKQQFCVYCKNPYTKIARHLRRQHAHEKDVAHALSFPKGSKKRLLLLERLCKKGNYQHNIEVIRNGNGEIVPKIRGKGYHSMMEYLPCQYCLAFYLRRALLKHERSCKMKMNLQSCSNFLQPQDAKCHSQSDVESSIEPTSDLTSQPLARLSPFQLLSLRCSPEPKPHPNLDSSSQTSIGFCPDSVSQPNLESSSVPDAQSSSELLKEPSLESCDRTGLGSGPGQGKQFDQPSADLFSPINSDLGQPLSSETSLHTSVTFSCEATDQSSPPKSNFPSPESFCQTTQGTDPEPIPQLNKQCLESSGKSDPDLGLPLSADYCHQPTFSSSLECSPQSSFESCLQFMESCSPKTDYPNSCQQICLRIGPKPSPQTNQTSFESCPTSSLRSSADLGPLICPESSPCSQPSLALCLQAVVQDTPETDLLSTPESCCHPSVEWNSQSSPQSHLKSSMKSSLETNQKPNSNLFNQPSQSCRFKQQASLRSCSTYNLRSMLSPVPKVSPYIDRSAKSEHELDSEISSGSDLGLTQDEQSTCITDGNLDVMRQLAENFDLRSAMISSSCQNTSSYSEIGPTSENRTKAKSPSSPVSSRSSRSKNLMSNVLLSPSLNANDESVDSNECELRTVIEDESVFRPAENDAFVTRSSAEEPLKSPAAASRRRSTKNTKIKSKFSSISCLKATSRTKASSKSKVSTKSRVKGGKKVKTVGAQRPYGRKQFCVFCKRPVTKIARHLEMRHSKEKDVAHALSFPKGSKTRHLLLQQLRNKGNYQHNIKVLQNGSGEIIPLKRTKKNTSSNDYKSCPDCLGFFLKSESCRHQRSCKMKKDKNSHRKWSRSASNKTFALHDCLSEGCRGIVRSMRDDDISKQLRNDELICKFGNSLCEKRVNLKSQHSYVSQKMRELGRFMLAVKELDPSVEHLHQVCTESRFDLALEAAKKLGCFDQHSDQFKTPAIASKLGYSLKQATEIALGENTMGDEAPAQAKKFIELLETDWVTYIASHSCNEQSPAKQSLEDVAALTEDVIKMQDFLRRAEEQAKRELMENPNRKAWKNLRNSLLGTVALFNRGRKNAADKMLLKNYFERTKEPYSGDKREFLSKVQQSLNHKLIKIESICKDGSTSPVLLTERMESSLDILTKYREHVGVPADNQYMFARMEASTHVRASDFLKDLAQNCGANKPESFTSIRTHKSVSTIFQILSLNDHEMHHVAELVGGGSFNWGKLNENPLQLAEICNLLLKMDQEDVPHRENSHDTGKAATSAKDTVEGDCAPKDKRRKWSVEEQEAVRRHMAKYISLLKVPGKKDCLDCVRTEPDALKSRTWRDVKYYVHNVIQASKKKKSKQMEADGDGERPGGGADAMDAAADGPRPKRRRV